MERLLTGEIEIRGGRKLAGIALPWETRAPSYRERFERDSIQLAANGVAFDVNHDIEKPISWTGAGLIIESRAAGLYLESELSEANPVARRARQMVERGINGLSISFKPVKAFRDATGDRVIQMAVLTAVSLVRSPAYPARAELRRKPWARSRIMPAGVRACSCVGPTCTKVEFKADAFSKTINLVLKGDRDLVAHVGGFSPDKVLASVSAGSLAVSLDDEGALLAEFDDRVADTPAGKMLADSNEATAPVLRPLIDEGLSTFQDVDDTRVYTDAVIGSLLLKTAKNPEGWEGIEIEGREPDRRREDGGLLWL